VRVRSRTRGLFSSFYQFVWGSSLFLHIPELMVSARSDTAISGLETATATPITGRWRHV